MPYFTNQVKVHLAAKHKCTKTNQTHQNTQHMLTNGCFLRKEGLDQVRYGDFPSLPLFCYEEMQMWGKKSNGDV